jgi:hypothetical protein
VKLRKTKAAERFWEGESRRLSPAQGEPKRGAFWFSEFGALPQTPPKEAQEFHAVKLRKTKAAERFWEGESLPAWRPVPVIFWVCEANPQLKNGTEAIFEQRKG